MDADKNFSLFINEETSTNSKQTFYSEIKVFETSKNTKGSSNYKMDSNMLKEKLEEKVHSNLLSFSSVSLTQLLENELELAVVKDQPNYEESSNSRNLEQKEFDIPIEIGSFKSIISDKMAKSNWTAVDLQHHQSYKKSLGSVASVCRFNPFVIELFTKTKLNNDNLSYYNRNFQYLDSIMGIEKLCFECSSSKAITLKLTNQNLLPLYNLSDSSINSHKKLSAFIKLEKSMEIVQDALFSQVNVYSSPKSKIAFGELVEVKQLLKRTNTNKHVFDDQKCFFQPSLNVRKGVDNSDTKEFSQNNDLDTADKFILSTERVLSSINQLLVYPEIYNNIGKANSNNSMNQINGARLQLFGKFNDQLIASIVEKNFGNSANKFVPVQLDTQQNNLDLAFKYDTLKKSILFKDNISKQFFINKNEIYLQQLIHNDVSFKSKSLFSIKKNLSLVETSCTINLCSILSKSLSHEQLAKNAQPILKQTLIFNDTMIADSNERKGNSLENLSFDIPVNKAIICNSHNEIDKFLIHLDKTQLQSSAVINNISETQVALPENISSQTFNSELGADYKSLCHRALAKPSFPQNVELESFIGDVHSDFTSTIQSCSHGPENQIQVQYPPLPEIVVSTTKTKLISSSNNNLNVHSLFKGLGEFDKNHSFVQSEVSENIICNKGKGKTSVINIKGRFASEQQLIDTLSNTNIIEESDSSCQHKLPIYSKNTHLSQLLEGRSGYLLNQKVSETLLKSTVQLSQEILSVNNLSNMGTLPCLNKNQCDEFKKKELSDAFKSNSSHQKDVSIFSFSCSQQNEFATSSIRTLDKTIQFEDHDSLKAGDLDSEIDKAIEESINKYESFMCDKEVVATPDMSDKSSQTDAIISKERQLSCKRCLKFDKEDFRPYKRTKTGLKNGEESSFSNFEQVGSLNELMPNEIKCSSSSNPTCTNVNSLNKYNDLTATKNNVLQIISNDSSSTINQSMKDNINMDYVENSNLSDEFSLYDEDMDVEDELNWSKNYKELYEEKCVLPDQKVPIVEEEASKTESIKGPSSFSNTTPKKPILKVGLSRSARVKPLHQTK